MLKKYNIKEIHVPHYAELSVKNMYPKLIDKAHLRMYLPDYPEKVYPEREFFYSVVGTLFPKELLDIVSKARANRSLGETRDKSELIKLTPEVRAEIEKLLKFPSILFVYHNHV